MIYDALVALKQMYKPKHQVDKELLIKKCEEIIGSFEKQAMQGSKKISLSSYDYSPELVNTLRNEFNITLTYNPTTNCYEQFLFDEAFGDQT